MKNKYGELAERTSEMMKWENIDNGKELLYMLKNFSMIFRYPTDVMQ